MPNLPFKSELLKIWLWVNQSKPNAKDPEEPSKFPLVLN